LLHFDSLYKLLFDLKRGGKDLRDNIAIAYLEGQLPPPADFLKLSYKKISHIQNGTILNAAAKVKEELLLIAVHVVEVRLRRTNLLILCHQAATL